MICTCNMYFTPYSTSYSSGVILFAQDLSVVHVVNAYVYPPFAFIHPVLFCLREQRVGLCTCVLPLIKPVPVSWSLVQKHVVQSLELGARGDKAVIMVPSWKGFITDNKSLRWPQVAFRLRNWMTNIHHHLYLRNKYFKKLSEFISSTLEERLHNI